MCKKKSYGYIKNTSQELLSAFCIFMLLIPLFAVTALAEDATASNQVNSNNTLSASLISRIANIPATEKIGIIVILKDQQCISNGDAAIKSCQSGVVSLLATGQAQGKVKGIKQISIVNAVAAEATPDVITSVSQRSDVLKVELDNVVYDQESIF